MLGRTHMAVGAVGGAILAPVILHMPWVPVRQVVHGHLTTLPHGLVMEVMLAGAAVVGSMLPDLDQRDSLMAHKVERIGQFVLIGLLIALMVLFHWMGSYMTWALVILFGVLFGVRSNVTRVTGLGVLGALLMTLLLRGSISSIGGFLLVLWNVGVMFTRHRTFTHSGFGCMLFGVGTWMSLVPFHLHVMAVGIMIGYVLHLLADAVSGGIPILFPWTKRQGLRLIRTSSPWDHMIGGLALFAFFGLAVW